MTVAEVIRVEEIKICTECKNPTDRLIRERCSPCYERARRTGTIQVRTWPHLDPMFEVLLLPVPGTNATFARRVFAHIDTSGDCWRWTGAPRDDCYGAIAKAGRRGGAMLAHCAVWRLLVGPIPEGMVFDHLCRDRICVNPDHGEIVTPVENTRRGYGASRGLGERKFCGYGHPLDGIRRNRNTTVRYCKTCNRARVNELYVPKRGRFDADRAREVITRYKSGEKPADIATTMGINPNAARRIARDWRNGGYKRFGIPVTERQEAA